MPVAHALSAGQIFLANEPIILHMADLYWLIGRSTHEPRPVGRKNRLVSRFCAAGFMCEFNEDRRPGRGGMVEEGEVVVVVRCGGQH